MPRKPRVEFEGAVYHVFNRGNYRQPVFASFAAAHAFEKTLFECCEIWGWLLHAYTVMTNHYHLVVETPQANLGRGMHWMASTFCNRFNRFRKENGHLFQGRHQAILVEPGPALSRVVNYVHLNPVQAGIVPLEKLGSYLGGSCRWFLSRERPAFLVCKAWLAELKLTDTAAGWKDYFALLLSLARDPAEQKHQGFDALETGWAIGDESWRKEIASIHRIRLAESAARGADHAELKQLRWHRALDEFLAQAGQSREAAAGQPKGARWKIDLAGKMRRAVGASLPWLAKELHMGKATSLRVYLSRSAAKINN